MNQFKSILFGILALVIFIMILPTLIYIFLFLILLLILIFAWQRYKINRILDDAKKHQYQYEQENDFYDNGDIIDVEFSESEANDD